MEPITKANKRHKDLEEENMRWFDLRHNFATNVKRSTLRSVLISFFIPEKGSIASMKRKKNNNVFLA